MKNHLFCHIRRFWLFALLLLLNLNVTEVLAARSVFETTEIAASYLVQAQNLDGGWPLTAGGESDVEITALVMQALMFQGWGNGSGVIRRGVVYLIKHQSEAGSWNGNTAHTIFVLMALAQAGTDAEAQFKGLKWLKEVQNDDGVGGVEYTNPAIPSTRAPSWPVLEDSTLNRTSPPYRKPPVGSKNELT